MSLYFHLYAALGLLVLFTLVAALYHITLLAAFLYGFLKTTL